MNRQTPTSRRSPSILVTDVRHSKAHAAPFVARRLNSLSVDSILSNTSEVPSAHRRMTRSNSNFGGSSHRSPVARRARRGLETMPLLDPPSQSETRPVNYSDSGSTNSSDYGTLDPGSASGAVRSGTSALTSNLRASRTPSVKPIPQLGKPLPSRTSKQSQRLVLIPDSDKINDNSEAITSLEMRETIDTEETTRVTSYLISEGVMLKKVANFLKTKHRARVRLYDEALFADYLLPLLPGDGVDYRVQSSRGDDRSMERMIDISEQRDHHYEYFTASETPEDDSSEPQDFSPRPNADNPLQSVKKDHDSRLTPTDHSHSRHQQGSHKSTNTQGNNHHHHHHHLHKNGHEEDSRKKLDNMRKLDHYLSHAELFVFNYGVLVFWNFKEAQEKQILADLSLGSSDVMIINSYNDSEIQSEELKFTYDLGESDKPRIFNDIIFLNSNSHMLKLAMSHAMAQSTILCGFEDRMQANLKDVRTVPKTLALTGKLGINREQLLKISGRLYKLRVDVNLSSNVLDIPDFFWDSEPSLFPLFNALREYLEIEERVLVLNERQSVFLELASILGDSIAEFNMDRITLIVIWLIVLSICVSLTEIFVRFLVINRK